MMKRRGRERHRRQLRLRIRHLLLVRCERECEGRVRVGLLAHRIGHVRAEQGEAQREAGGEGDEALYDGGDEHEQLVHAHLDHLPARDSDRNLADEWKAFEDDRHERERRAALRRRRRLPVRGVEDTALVIRRRCAEGVDELGHGRELCRRLLVEGHRASGVRVLLVRGVVEEERLDECEEPARLRRRRHRHVLRDHRADEHGGDLLLAAEREVREQRRPGGERLVPVNVKRGGLGRGRAV
mmetsp:Transcript_36286/g.95660  ORF Transcript_36286/g.95660 Transcript_36286/m.95660 type:complete len:241 (-) Transcript_36286:82-804(-)